MKRQLVLLSTVLVLSSAVLSPITSYAENFEAQIQKNNETIQALQKEQAEKLQQLSTLVSDIENTQLQVNAISQEIQNTQNQIITLETEITYLNEVIAKRAEKIVEQARYLQTENTSDDFLKAIFSSQSIVEVFEKIWAMTELTSASNDVLQQQKLDKEKVIAKKEELDAKLEEQGERAAQIQILATEQATRRQNLEAVLAEIEAQTLNAQAQNTELTEQLKQARRVQEQLAAERQVAQQSAAAAAVAQAEQERQTFAASHGQSNSSSNAPANNTPTRSASSNSKPIPGGGNFAAIDPSYVAALNGGYPGQCTWYVYNRLAYLGAPIKHMLMGNGGEWGHYGRVNGYSVSNTPKAGTAVSWQGGEAGISTHYGHVAFVEKVNADGSILVSEMNYKGEFVISTRVVSAADALLGDYIDFGL